MAIHSDPDLASELPYTPGANSVPEPINQGDYTEYVDYFGFDERERWMFPDGQQWIEFKKLNEGERAKFLKATRSDVHLNQRSGEARIPFDQSKERKQLLLHSCTDWFTVRKNPRNSKWEPVAFANNGTEGCAFAQWIDKANPAVLSRLEKAIRMANPWLMAEMTVEQIDKEISDLQELREAAAKREAEEKNS